MEQAVIFVFGAINYMAIEILWRGHTHWSMALAGGLCAMLIYVFTRKFSRKNLFVKSLIGAIIITITELVTGIIFNVFLKLDVWDYSHRAFNFMGQICLSYCILWFLLCIPVVKLFEYFHKLKEL